MRKMIIALALMALSGTVHAQDYKYLTVATSSSENSIELATVQKITFDMSEKLVLVSTSNGVVKFPLSELQKMYFTDAATRIAALPTQSDALRVVKGALEVKGKGVLRIYDASGKLQRMTNLLQDNSSVSLSGLSAGTYIVNIGSQTIKVRK